MQWYEGFALTPLPVMHGADFESMGFAFGNSNTDSLVVYLSDVSRVLDTTLQWIKKQGQVEMLTLMLLFMHTRILTLIYIHIHMLVNIHMPIRIHKLIGEGADSGLLVRPAPAQHALYAA
jgi:hypothetical protein